MDSVSKKTPPFRRDHRRHTYGKIILPHGWVPWDLGITLELHQCLFGYEWLTFARRFYVHCGIFSLWLDFPFNEKEAP